MKACESNMVVPGGSWAQGLGSVWGRYRTDADMELHFASSADPLWPVTFNEPSAQAPPLTVGSPFHVEDAKTAHDEKEAKV